MVGRVIALAANTNFVRHPEEAREAGPRRATARAVHPSTRVRRAPQDDGSTSNAVGMTSPAFALACLRLAWAAPPDWDFNHICVRTYPHPHRRGVKIASSCSFEGVIMRRLGDGAGCGARADASQASVREAPGSRPALLRGSAFDGCTWRGRRAAKAARIGLSQKPPGSAPGSPAPGTENRRLWRAERRRASATMRAHKEWLRRLARHPLAFGGGRLPRTPCSRGKGKTGDPGASTKNTGGEALDLPIRAAGRP